MGKSHGSSFATFWSGKDGEQYVQFISGNHGTDNRLGFCHAKRKQAVQYDCSQWLFVVNVYVSGCFSMIGC